MKQIRPVDFSALRAKMSKSWGLHRIAKGVQCVRSVFMYTMDMEMIDKHIKFGPDFKKPSKDKFRRHKHTQDEKTFTADEIKRMLSGAGAQGDDHARHQLRVRQCRLRDADAERCEQESGLARLPRAKNALPRRCPLWPETTLSAWLKERPTPAGAANADLVFVTAKGRSWQKETSDNPVSKETAKLLKKLKINSRRL